MNRSAPERDRDRIGRSAAGPQRVARLPGFALDALLVVAATLLVYWSDLGFGWFGVDDASYVTDNPLVLEPSAAHLRAILSEPYVGNWSPLHLLSYWLDRALGGDAAWVMHLSNNLWAAACAVGVLGLGRQLLASRGAALAAALLFVVHPTHVEAVAWISSRKDLIATAFGLPAWCCWIRCRAATGRARAGWYAAALALFVLALAGKLSIVVLPAILVVHDLVIERRRGVGVLLDKLPFALCVAAFGLVVAGAQPETNVVRSAGDLAQIGYALLVQLFGLGAPTVFRPIPAAELDVGLELAQGLAAAGVIAGGLWLVRRQPTLLVLAVAALLALVPAQVLRFVYPVSDRYLFLATAPLTMLLVGAALAAVRARSRVSAAAVAALVLLGGGWTFLTVRALGEWGDPRSAWYAASRRVSDINTHEYLGEHWLASAEEILQAGVAREPLPERAQALAEVIGYGTHRMDVLRREWDEELPHRPSTDALVRDLLERADEQFDLALAIPTERVLPSLHYRRGRLHDLRGDPGAALTAFERAYADAQRFPAEIVANVFRVQSLYAMGLMAERLGDQPRALGYVRRALAEQRALGGRTPEIEAELEAEVERLQREVDGG